MTTAIPRPKGTSAAEIPQPGDKRWIGPLDREDPKIDERIRLPRQQSAVAETESHLEEERFLDMITRNIVALHEWLAGPPMTAQERVKNDITEHNRSYYEIIGRI